MAIQVRYEGLDGNEVMTFATLVEAGKYLKAQCVFARGDRVCNEYAWFVPVGFDLSDVGRYNQDLEFEFFDWAGGSLVSGKYRVVRVSYADFHEDRPGLIQQYQTVLASSDHLPVAIQGAMAAWDAEKSDPYGFDEIRVVDEKGKVQGWMRGGKYLSSKAWEAKFDEAKARYDRAQLLDPAPF